MKKAALLMVIVLVISLPMSVVAAPRDIAFAPVLSFNGLIATCGVDVYGDSTSDYIEVTMKLMDDFQCVGTWHQDGYCYVSMTKKALVAKGRNYTLTVEVTINGVARAPVSVSAAN